MPEWLVRQAELVGVIGKALLMYGVAVVGLRVAHRRTLSQWTAIDFSAAVAIGAVMGRTAVAEGQSFLVGAAMSGRRPRRSTSAVTTGDLAPRPDTALEPIPQADLRTCRADDHV